MFNIFSGFGLSRKIMVSNDVKIKIFKHVFSPPEQSENVFVVIFDGCSAKLNLMSEDIRKLPSQI